MLIDIDTDLDDPDDEREYALWIKRAFDPLHVDIQVVDQGVAREVASE